MVGPSDSDRDTLRPPQAPPGRQGVTRAEIAEHYGRNLRTITTNWARHPQFPHPIGRRGRHYEYDPQAVHDAVMRLFLRPAPTPQGDPDDLLTIKEIAEYTGLAPVTIRADISRGRLPKARPEDRRGDVDTWPRHVINTIMSRRSRSGPRRNTPPKPGPPASPDG